MVEVTSIHQDLGTNHGRRFDSTGGPCAGQVEASTFTVARRQSRAFMCGCFNRLKIGSGKSELVDCMFCCT
jgi:hypothetical protein